MTSRVRSRTSSDRRTAAPDRGSLNRDVADRRERLASLGDVDRPVQRDHIGAALGQQLEIGPMFRAKTIVGTSTASRIS